MSTQHLSTHKPIIGIIGGIGSGKSLVAQQLHSLGAAVFDADTIAKAMLDKPEVQKKLIQWWGNEIIGENGIINKSAVADITFTDQRQRQRLESLIHPLVSKQKNIFTAHAQTDPEIVAIVLDVPLLLESNWHNSCDCLIFVETDKNVRYDRVAKQRNWNNAELDRREKNQLPLDKKKKLAHNIIVNNSDTAECFTQVRKLLTRLLQIYD